MNHAERYEVGFLLSLLDDQSLLGAVELTPESFLNGSTRLVYSTICDMAAANEPVDLITVCDNIGKTTGKNYFGVVAGWVKDYPKASDPKWYAQVISQAYEASMARSIALDLIDNVNSENAVPNAIQALINLSAPTTRFDHDTKSVMTAAIESIENPKHGLKTGLLDLDNLLGGFHGGDLVILGARPAMGKTACMLNLALGLLSNNIQVGIFSGEQGHEQVGQRLAAIQSGVGLEKLRTNSMSDDELTKFSAGIHRIANMSKFVLYDKPAPTLGDISRKARQWHHNGCRAIFIDYLQRIHTDSKLPKHEAIGAVAKGLKELARDLNIPVICLAQVNRQVESRQDKRPSMGDLKDSGEIEQEADQVFMLYRDEVYDPDSMDKGVAELIIEKNRHGRTGLVRLAFSGGSLRFSSLARGY
jgi:replicative DNA helicase